MNKAIMVVSLLLYTIAGFAGNSDYIQNNAKDKQITQQDLKNKFFAVVMANGLHERANEEGVIALLAKLQEVRRNAKPVAIKVADQANQSGDAVAIKVADQANQSGDDEQ